MEGMESLPRHRVVIRDATSAHSPSTVPGRSGAREPVLGSLTGLGDNSWFNMGYMLKETNLGFPTTGYMVMNVHC